MPPQIQIKQKAEVKQHLLWLLLCCESRLPVLHVYFRTLTIGTDDGCRCQAPYRRCLVLLRGNEHGVKSLRRSPVLHRYTIVFMPS